MYWRTAAIRVTNGEDLARLLVVNLVRVETDGAMRRLADGESLIRDIRYKPRYWCKESKKFDHRHSSYAWAQGSVFEDKPEHLTPIVLDWNSAILKADDATTWPPKYALLSDLMIYNTWKESREALEGQIHVEAVRTLHDQIVSHRMHPHLFIKVLLSSNLHHLPLVHFNMCD